MGMSSKKHQIPAIRFKGFTDAWEQRKFKNFIFKAGKKNTKGEDFPAFSVSNKLGLVNQSEQFDGSRLDNLDKTAYKLVNPGEFAYNPARINVGSIALNNLEETVIVSSLYVVLKMDDRLDNEFILQFIKSNNFINEVIKNTEGSVREYLFFENFKNVRFPYVSNIEEQIKIGVLFKQLDNTINLHQRQQDNYKQLKKYMLQKIFNQEFRFKDENGNDYPDWEEIALKELGETFTGLSGKTKENFGKGKGKFVTYMNVFSNSTANLAMTENVEIEDGEKQNEVRYGDIFFTTSSETPDEVGMSSVWLSHESNVYLNSFCFGYRLNSESEGKVTHQFLGVQLRADHIRKQIVFLAQGSTRFNISKAKLTEIPVYLPAIQEQQKIADFLSMLDLRIEQLSQKVELLKEQKKGLIQQMFV